jgi:hypothetical protein
MLPPLGAQDSPGDTSKVSQAEACGWYMKVVDTPRTKQNHFKQHCGRTASLTEQTKSAVLSTRSMK